MSLKSRQRWCDRQRRLRVLLAAAVGLSGLLVGLSGCSVNSPKRRYVLAEKLWADGKYRASVAEFDRVTAKDPKGELGLQALYRSAMTQSLYLDQHAEAIRKFRTYAEASAYNPKAEDAKRQVGDILFSRLERFPEAITHYRSLIAEGRDTTALPEFRLRLAKSYFYVWQFSDALAQYQELIRLFPGTPQAERAAFEIGVTHYTQGERSRAEDGAFLRAIDSYQRFLKDYPQSRWAPEARFGIGASLEELDRLPEALEAFEAVKKSHPSPNSVEIRIRRIRERSSQKNREAL